MAYRLEHPEGHVAELTVIEDDLGHMALFTADGGAILLDVKSVEGTIEFFLAVGFTLDALSGQEIPDSGGRGGLDRR